MADHARRNHRTTNQAQGRRFEEQVARWVKIAFNESHPEVELNKYATGLTVNRPYQIDVCVHVKGRGLFGRDLYMWVECKWSEKASVKRIDIMKLVASAQDVYRAANAGRNPIYYDGLMVVSNQTFDDDALNYANQEEVLCVMFDGKRYKPQTDSENWIGNPRWLKNVSG